MHENSKKPRLLVIDDTSLIKEHLSQKVLDQYEALYEIHGKEAIEHMEEYKPDVILIQLMLSQMDSFEICMRIRALLHEAQPLIIILSNTKFRKSIQDVAYKSGVDKILFSPLENDIVESLILNHRPKPLSLNA